MHVYLYFDLFEKLLKHNLFYWFTLSDYAILTSLNCKEVSLDINSKSYIFAFDIYHVGINICNIQDDFTFSEKLYIGNADINKLKWTRITKLRLEYLLEKYCFIEPNHFFIDMHNKCFGFIKTGKSYLYPINEFHLI